MFSIRILFVVLLVVLSSSLKAQTPVADFSASQLSGCAPFTVSFKDLSTGNPKFWNWDLGNGQLSNQQNPVASYSQPGKYSITLVARNADGTDGITKTDYITVNASPAVAFTQSASIGCIPTSISFYDASVSSGGGIQSWLWNFGDGTTSTLQNPSHAYSAGGFYSVSLTVTDRSGCTAGTTAFRSVRIVSGVTADFSNMAPPTCRPPYTISFKNETSGPGNITYSWDLGNSSSSTIDNPITQYTADGIFPVKLIARSEYGCVDSVEKSVSITGISTTFSSADTACLYSTVNFQNTSAQKALFTSWYLDGVLFSTDSSVSRFFNEPGLYTIKLVNQYTQCKDSVSKTIRILGKPAINFTANQTVACKAPFTVTFQDQTPNAAGWRWDFGNGNTSSQQNPQHTYQAIGLYPVTLIATDIFGCSDTLRKENFISIVTPVVGILNAPAGGCIPFTLSPRPNITAVDGVAGYLWNFGDGTTSTAINPTHLYPNAGTYNLSLRITTNGGCTDSLILVNGVRTGTPSPVVDFSVSTPAACAFGPVSFTDLSVSPPVDQWSWNFGDGNSSAERNPIHSYSDTGSFTISLTAFNNGCPRTITKTNILSISPPIAKFIYAPDCNDLRRVSFKNESIVDPGRGTVSYLWQFGDPANTTSTELDPVFTYPAIGTYTATLTVFNDTCSHQITQEVELLSETADFSINKNKVCKGEAFELSAINSDASNIQSYQWKIGTDAPFPGNRVINPVLNINGVYDLELTVIDKNGCQNSKTLSDFITVVGPTAAFTPSASTGCTNTIVSFTDGSISADKIIRWIWDFGDGTISEFSAPPFNHQYKDTGWFNVKLTVQDGTGCTNAVTQANAIHINDIKAFFIKDTTIYCPGLNIAFKDSSSGNNLSYRWDFGDGSISTDPNPFHKYTGGDNIYTVKLSVQDDQGCTDSLIRTNYITIKAPKPAFEISDTTTICPPFETQFTLKGTDYESHYWDFGDESDISLVKNPRHFYNSFETFTAKLYVIGFGGCIDSVSQDIHVINPASTVIDYNPLSACNRLTVDFNIQPPTDTRFIFSFGDGAVDSSQATSFSHFYGSPAFYYPSITLFDNTGCQASIGGPSLISIIGAQPLFGVDNNAFCDSGTVYFTNYTVGNDPVVSYNWDLGDGTVSMNKDQIHTYKQPGTFVASLEVTTQSGCTNIITDTIRVHRTPLASIISSDTLCINTPALFRSNLLQADTASIQYTWNFGNGETSSMRDHALTYAQTGDYTVRLDTRVAFGCNTSTSKNINVAPLPVIDLQQELVALSGSGLTIPVTYTGPITNYSWTPAAGLSCTDCPNPYANPKSTTTYKVTVTDKYGCINSRDVTVTIVCNNQNLFIPNTFSPNSDGSNDHFYPRGTGLFRIRTMKIFNRWGEPVFEKINFNANQSSAGWDGSFKGKKAEPDVYVYLIEIVCENGEILPFKGNVLLMR